MRKKYANIAFTLYALSIIGAFTCPIVTLVCFPAGILFFIIGLLDKKGSYENYGRNCGEVE